MKKSTRRSENPDPIDVHVGRRLRERRSLMGLSQDQLGKALGLTFQQIQKYEHGTNRMGSSRLYHIASLLGVTVQWFFDGLEGGIPSNDNPSMPTPDILHRRETLELVRAYHNIEDDKARRKIYELMRSMATN